MLNVRSSHLSLEMMEGWGLTGGNTATVQKTWNRVGGRGGKTWTYWINIKLKNILKFILQSPDLMPAAGSPPLLHCPGPRHCTPPCASRSSADWEMSRDNHCSGHHPLAHLCSAHLRHQCPPLGPPPYPCSWRCCCCWNCRSSPWETGTWVCATAW